MFGDFSDFSDQDDESQKFCRNYTQICNMLPDSQDPNDMCISYNDLDFEYSESSSQIKESKNVISNQELINELFTDVCKYSKFIKSKKLTKIEINDLLKEYIINKIKEMNTLVCKPDEIDTISTALSLYSAGIASMDI